MDKRTSSPTDQSIGHNHEQEKIYHPIHAIAGNQPQVYHGMPIERLRIIQLTDGGFKLQNQIAGDGRGEETETLWVDLPVYNENEEFMGYVIKE